MWFFISCCNFCRVCPSISHNCCFKLTSYRTCFGSGHPPGLASVDFKEDNFFPEMGYTDPEYFRTQLFTDKSDVFSFGVLLLEILCGRKIFDTDFMPPNLVEWAAPCVRKGDVVTILDKSLELPKNVEPLVKMAGIAELCVRDLPEDRPGISDVASWLELIGRANHL